MPIIITMAFSINILNARGCRAIIHPRTSGSPERWLLLNEKRDYNKRGIIRRVEEMQADFYLFFFFYFFSFSNKLFHKLVSTPTLIIASFNANVIICTGNKRKPVESPLRGEENVGSILIRY